LTRPIGEAAFRRHPEGLKRTGGHEDRLTFDPGKAEGAAKMLIPSNPRKVFQGVATRHEMYRLFDRHAQRSNRWHECSSSLYAGEWFEIAEPEYQMMLEILPPLWMRGGMFAMSEFLTGHVTSVFFELRIDGRVRHFHGYCDLAHRGSPERMRDMIIERETRPIKAMTRAEKLEHIWSSTHDDYRGYAGERWPEPMRGRRTILVYGGQANSVLKLLDDLCEAEIAAKLPVQFRHLPELLTA
jgi:hypothetical protein